ncbi:MAG: acetyl-CoA carboxylase biotin carboxyl carrier protein [Saprospiraceae bacterium]|nr:acetyl-CoA carboxylase biotin carboxyl carrier protein [Saprospiraceae bacterium]
MNFNEIQELIKLMNKSNLSEFKMKEKDFEILIRTEKYHKGTSTVIAAPAATPSVSVTSAPQMIAQPSSAKAEDVTPAPQPAASSKNIVEIKSPIVGTFYRSPGPDKPLFVKIGDTVKQGDVVCIIEAMKLFNEIESDVSGTIVKVLVEDASPVEYDQVLYLVEL